MSNTITRGDTMPLVVSWYLPNADHPYTDHDAHLNDATIRVVRQKDGKIVLDEEPATIDGNETIFVIEPEHLQIDGPYAAFMTAVFHDGTTMTRRINFTVVPRR